MSTLTDRRQLERLIILMLVVFAIATTVILVKTRQEVRERAAGTTSLEITPQTKTSNQGEEVAFDILMRTGTNQVTRADLTVNYDPFILQGIAISGGTFLPQIEKIGVIQNGTANIVLTAPLAQPAQGNGVIATIILRGRNPTTGTDISISPASALKALSETGNILISVTPATLVVTRTRFPETILNFGRPDTVAAGAEFTADVLINTGSNRVTVADLTINYDANILEGLAAEPTSLLPKLLNSPTVTGGTVHIILGSSGSTPLSGTGAIAKLKFRAVNAGTAALTFAGTTKIGATETDENMFKEGVSQTVTVTDNQTQPAATPETTPAATPGTGGPAGNTGTCTKIQPLPPTGFYASIPGPNQVMLHWDESVYATHYGIAYGKTPGNYIYGAPDLGYTTNYTVNGLANNTTYYFSVYAVNDCVSSGNSPEIAVTTRPAQGGGAPVYYPPAAATTPKPANASTTDNIPYLGGRGDIPLPTTADLPRVVVPEETGTTGAVKTGTNPFLTPLGGIFLIIAAIFLGIFFFRMRDGR